METPGKKNLPHDFPIEAQWRVVFNKNRLISGYTRATSCSSGQIFFLRKKTREQLPDVENPAEGFSMRLRSDVILRG